MKKILLSLALIAVVSAGAVGATRAYFSDTETSNNNTFSAGTLDLKLNGGDSNVTLFNVSNMRPGNQPTGSLTLKNAGTIDVGGKLSISGVVLTSYENGCLDPEVGDPSCDNPGEGMGELQNVLNLRVYIDNAPVTGYYGAEDVMIYSGLMKDLGSTIPISKTLLSGEETHLNYVIDWWDTASDNLAQSDGVKLDMTFGLTQ